MQIDGVQLSLFLIIFTYRMLTVLYREYHYMMNIIMIIIIMKGDDRMWSSHDQ